MNKRHPQSSLIERRLEQLSSTDADSLWNDMRSILDKKMPQKKGRRRFAGWWFIISKPLFLVSVGVIAIAAVSLCFLTGKETSTAIVKNSQNPQQSNKINVTKKVIDLNDSKENRPVENRINKGSNNIASAVSSSTNITDKVNDGNFIVLQSEERSKSSKDIYLFNQSIHLTTSLTSSELDPTPADLYLINKDVSTKTEHVKEKNNLTLQPYQLNNTKKNKSVNNHKTGFYAGILTGIDLSSIHFQSAKTGSTKGFIVGYALNNTWSIESGIFWDTKRVFDNGGHFDPPGYTPSNGMKIIAVNGKTRLYELPINVKYSIVQGKHNLFATTGLSSYFMRSENYDYEYTQNNQPGGHNYLTYRNQSKDWFSVVNISLGYTHKLGSAGNLRVEPYLKLPLKDIGVGKMPIISTGLNIGFIKTIR